MGIMKIIIAQWPQFFHFTNIKILQVCAKMTLVGMAASTCPSTYLTLEAWHYLWWTKTTGWVCRTMVANGITFKLMFQSSSVTHQMCSHQNQLICASDNQKSFPAMQYKTFWNIVEPALTCTSTKHEPFKQMTHEQNSPPLSMCSEWLIIFTNVHCHCKKTAISTWNSGLRRQVLSHQRFSI